MRFEITHITSYDYQAEVSSSQHVARLSPRLTPTQLCLEHSLVVLPTPTQYEQRRDYFGNDCVFFNIDTPFKQFSVTAKSLVEVNDIQPLLPFDTLGWELARDFIHNALPDSEAGRALEYCFASPLIPKHPDFAAYAQPSFPPGRPILEAAMHLMGRIHREFQFAPAATTVNTPIQEVLKKRQGVCQDFAQVQIACLRSLGLAARYVSGYIETLPPPGKPKLVGADASHAWLSVFCPNFGWVDLDPTNNTKAHTQHITVAWGRDFTDISPLRGVFLGSGTHLLSVSVDVNRVST